ncbi:MAG: 23S rRNA (pseudouridine(1915)-N(3))-methyltransferase RlmH [Oligoflexia bacterium]|nr:23S rRNA (pseudouridine(1915)-N(3))-methyltransferase RlmH [Oligoflexia bacterium]
MSRVLNLIVVGKLKDKHFENLETEYRKRLNKFQLIIHETRSFADTIINEEKEILKKVDEITSGERSRSHIVLLSENGKEYSSQDFSLKIFDLLKNCSTKKIIIIIGGAHGFTDGIIKMSSETISLSKLTFPHRLARIILIEQLYRAQTIEYGHPYHH